MTICWPSHRGERQTSQHLVRLLLSLGPVNGLQPHSSPPLTPDTYCSQAHPPHIQPGPACRPSGPRRAASAQTLTFHGDVAADISATPSSHPRTAVPMCPPVSFGLGPPQSACWGCSVRPWQYEPHDHQAGAWASLWEDDTEPRPLNAVGHYAAWLIGKLWDKHFRQVRPGTPQYSHARTTRLAGAHVRCS
jgi:hypothetical protein